MKIFLDLDDTLIFSVFRGRNKEYEWHTFVDGDVCGSKLRAISKDLIEFCRSIVTLVYIKL